MAVPVWMKVKQQEEAAAAAKHPTPPAADQTSTPPSNEPVWKQAKKAAEAAAKSSAGAGGSTPAAAIPSTTGGIQTRFGTAPTWLSNLVRKYFNPQDWVKALEVSYMESGWSTSAINDTRGKAGGDLNQPYVTAGGLHALTEDSVGLFQINIGAHGGTEGYWSNPELNVAKAAELVNRSGGWGDWKISAGRLGYYGDGAPTQTAAGAGSTAIPTVPSSAVGDSKQRSRGKSGSRQGSGAAAGSPGPSDSGAGGITLLHSPLLGDVTLPAISWWNVFGFAVGTIIIVIALAQLAKAAGGEAAARGKVATKTALKYGKYVAALAA